MIRLNADFVNTMSKALASATLQRGGTPTAAATVRKSTTKTTKTTA